MHACALACGPMLLPAVRCMHARVMAAHACIPFASPLPRHPCGSHACAHCGPRTAGASPTAGLPTVEQFLASLGSGANLQAIQAALSLLPYEDALNLQRYLIVSGILGIGAVQAIPVPLSEYRAHGAHGADAPRSRASRC